LAGEAKRRLKRGGNSRYRRGDKLRKEEAREWGGGSDQMFLLGGGGVSQSLDSLSRRLSSEKGFGAVVVGKNGFGGGGRGGLRGKEWYGGFGEKGWGTSEGTW